MAKRKSIMVSKEFNDKITKFMGESKMSKARLVEYLLNYIQDMCISMESIETDIKISELEQEILVLRGLENELQL